MKENERREKELHNIEFGGEPVASGRPADPGESWADSVTDSPGEEIDRPAVEAGRQAPAAEATRPAGEAAGQNGGADPGFLELIYGVLFDPVRTFRRIAASPPMGKIVLVFSIVKVLSVLVFVVGGLSSQQFMFSSFPGHAGQGMAGVMRAMAPMAAVLGLVYEYFKWFIYSGILYFLAELFGGRGRAVGVLATTGLASLPALIILPLQMLAFILRDNGASPVGVLLWLAILAWGTVLVVLGLRETQQLSTGRAVAVAFTPAAGVILLFILLLVFIVAVVAPLGLPAGCTIETSSSITIQFLSCLLSPVS